jgi:hypothetical protein
MVEDLKIYKNNNLTFILDDEKIVVKTPLQTFFLTPNAHYWNKRMNLIRLMIKLNEIHNLSELATWCNGRVSWTVTNKYRQL